MRNRRTDENAVCIFVMNAYIRVLGLCVYICLRRIPTQTYITITCTHNIRWLNRVHPLNIATYIGSGSLSTLFRVPQSQPFVSL